MNNYYITLEIEEQINHTDKFFLCKNILGNLFWKFSKITTMEDIYWMTKENCIKTNEEIMREIISYKKFIQEHRNVEKNFLKNWFPILTDSENLIDVENASLKINKLEDFN